MPPSSRARNPTPTGGTPAKPAESLLGLADLLEPLPEPSPSEPPAAPASPASLPRPRPPQLRPPPIKPPPRPVAKPTRAAPPRPAIVPPPRPAPRRPTPSSAPAGDPEATVLRPSSSSASLPRPRAADPEATVMRPASSSAAWPKAGAADPEATAMHVSASGSGPSPARADAELTSMYKPGEGPPVPTENELTSLFTGGSPGAADDDATRMRDDAPERADDIATRLVAAASGSAQILPRAQQRRSKIADDELPKGTIVGRYVILERIGTGGMGSVYAAFDPELDRKVAVKLLHSMLTRGPQGSDAHNRLLREAQAMAKLSHPAVVTVHDVGVFKGQVFMAMEFVEGSTLKEWVKAQPRSWREVLRVFIAAGHGLAAAHAAGLIHRDFKPTNVLISENERVRVLDFGLARRTEYVSADDGESSSSSSSSGSGSGSASGPRMTWAELVKNGEVSMSLSASSLDMNLTQAGSIMGSPAYMAPEQHMGQPTDPRTDGFSFCVALYEALYGKRPFDAEDNRLLVYAILEKRFHKPGRESRVPGWLRKVLLRGLSPSPEERYPSMQELLADLGRDPGRAARRWMLALGGLLGTGAVAAAVVWPYLNPPEISEDANAYIEQLAAEAHEAAARAQFVYPPKDDPDATTAFKKILELERIDDETKKVATERATELRREFAATLVTIGDRYWDQEGGKPFATDYYAQALVFDEDDARAKERASLTVGQLANLRRKADEADFSRQELVAAEPLAALAETDEEERKQKVASMLAEEGDERSVIAEAHLEELLAADDEARTRAKAKKKKVVRPTPAVPVPESSTPSGGDASEAAAPDDDAGGDAAKAKKKRDPKAAKALADDGRAALRETRWKDAERLFQQALSLDRGCAAALMGLSDLHFDRSEYGKAVSYAEKAVAAAPRNAGYRIKLGDVYYKVVRYADAKKSYQAAADLGHAGAAAKLEKLERATGG